MNAAPVVQAGIDFGGTGTRFAIVSAGAAVAVSEAVTGELGEGTPADA